MERYSNISFAHFHSEFIYLLGKNASVNKGYTRTNQKDFIDRRLNRAIMVRLCSKFLKLKTEGNRLAYAKKRNYCVKLLHQKKRQYFVNLNHSSVTDNKLFWETVSPLFTKKNGSNSNKITLFEGGKVLTDDAKIAETFHSFFRNIMNKLNIEKGESVFFDTGDETDPLLHAIKRYSKHPSIFKDKIVFQKSD